MVYQMKMKDISSGTKHMCYRHSTIKNALSSHYHSLMSFNIWSFNSKTDEALQPKMTFQVQNVQPTNKELVTTFNNKKLLYSLTWSIRFDSLIKISQ